jgi:hypothetical protein
VRGLIVVFLLCAVAGCNSSVYDFKVEQEGYSTRIKLFKDSTFVSHAEVGGTEHSYAGYWRGNPEDGGFKAMATRDGFDILENELQFTFRGSGADLKLIAIDTLPPKY